MLMSETLPALDCLGDDLLVIPGWRRALSLALPFVIAVGFFLLWASGSRIGPVVCAGLVTFFTYGSISHDLVHGSLRLPRTLNHVLLCGVELITLRSGHAYRVTHLHHHARFPAGDDLEGAAAGMSWWRALLDGVSLQPRLWLFAYRRGRHRVWIVGEAMAILVLLVASIAALRWTFAPLVYSALMLGGSWMFPLITSFIPHDPTAPTELGRTRLFRGTMLSIVALDHFYHLEHHLYPHVPHHRWPELARRLDPYFARAGLRPVRIWF
jgi:beta-carotene hydroxylase